MRSRAAASARTRRRTNPGEQGDFGDTDDPDPVPSFESPLRDDESSVRLRPGDGVKAELFVGDYEANVTPVVDTDPATALGDTVKLLPGTYAFVVRANGRGTQKFTRAVPASGTFDLSVVLPLNRASKANGATVTADSEGVNRDDLIDDTEETNWAVVDRAPDVSGAALTVKLAGGEQLVDRVNVSALLHAPDDSDTDDPDSQNRFTALRQFELQACSGACANDADFTSIYTSPADAFPGGVPRPLAPDMNLRSFDVPNTQATHLRFVVRHNQCTGSPLYPRNDLDSDPVTNSSCTMDNPPLIARSDQTVRAAELQVFSEPAAVTLAPVPVTPPANGGTNPTPSGSSPATPTTRPATPAACASTAGFRSVSARPRGRGLRIAFARRVESPVNVDVFQQSRGRRIIDNLLVARFPRRTRAFTWNGRARNAKRVTPGHYFVRFRMPQGAGRLDQRRVAVVRTGRGFRSARPFYGRSSCALVTSYKLRSAVFGGLQGGGSASPSSSPGGPVSASRSCGVPALCGVSRPAPTAGTAPTGCRCLPRASRPASTA